MAGEQSGVGYRPRHVSRRGIRRSRGKRAAPASAESRAVIRVVICGIIFVALVAVKLLFPEAVGALAHSAGNLIGRNADFQEAFAAMGRAISGEEAVSDSLQDAYTAVFSPSSGVVEADAAPAAATEPLLPGGKLLRYATVSLPIPEDTAEESGEAADGEETAASPSPPPAPEPEEDDTTTAALSYVYALPALPENASLEQRNLGFVYDSPLRGSLTSTFGWREHPVSGGTKFHYGIDLAADQGSAVCAFADGVVYATGESSTLGKYIMLQHQGGYMTLYAHCSDILTGSGSVTLGQQIAKVGETGVATGPHLHFELHDGDLYLNPIYYVEVG